MRALAVAVLLGLGTVAALTTASRAQQREARCGAERWAVKTLSDQRRDLIYFRPRPTTIDGINARRMPHPTPRLRSRGFERHVWRVVAQITEYKLQNDGDIHMILFDKDAYMIAEMPAPTCLRRTTRD